MPEQKHRKIWTATHFHPVTNIIYPFPRKHTAVRNILLPNNRPEFRLITLDTFHHAVYTTPSTKVSANAKIITSIRPLTVTWG